MNRDTIRQQSDPATARRLLTRRQWHAYVLLMEGFSDRAIAERMTLEWSGIHRMWNSIVVRLGLPTAREEAEPCPSP